MSNPFSASGASSPQSKYAPLYVNRFFTGLYSNSNPLAEAATSYLYQRFYSGSRYDTIRSGINVEISPRLTLIRRPGHSVYNSATFGPINAFYDFRIFNPATQGTQIVVIVDEPTAVYDGTGPSTRNLLFTKLAGAGQTSFQSVGNVLYAGDGVSTWKYLWFPQWQATTAYSTGTSIIDSNGNIQTVSGVKIPFTATQQVSVSSNIATVKWGTSGLFNAAQWSSAQLSELAGSIATLTGFSGASFLNGSAPTIQSVYNVFRLTPTLIENAYLTFPFINADYGPTVDTGSVNIGFGSANSGGSNPSWSATIGATTTDGSLTWTNKGSAVQDWGTVAPLSAPIVNNVLSIAGTAWVAATYYWPSPVIIDGSVNIQVLTTDGTTSTVPSFSSTPGATTADGTATWTCNGTGTRATTTAYAVGKYIAVTVAKTIQVVSGYDPNSHQYIYQYITISNYYFFLCTVAGTSSSSTTANIDWPAGLGQSVTDGTVSWINAGYQVTRLNSASISPASNAKGNVANSTLVTKVNSIVDNAGSGGGTGFTQNVALAGLSGGSHPTWAVAGGVEVAGLVTTDNGIHWYNAGPVGAANTGAWVYGYSFENSVSGEESSLSPLSTAITLQAQSVISVSGNGDPNWATDGVDTINIYRSVQGFTTPFLLFKLPAPSGGQQWSYIDASPDPPNPGSILNEFIKADQTGNNAPPPTGLTNLTFYLNRIFGSVGEFEYYSGVAGQPIGSGPSSFPGLNFWQLPELINQSWPSATGLLLFTVHGIYFSQGIDGNLNPNTPIRLLEDIGLLSRNLFAVNGSIPTIFTSDFQLITLDPSAGISRASDPIADLLAQYSNTNSYLAWHVNGIDSAYFLADGSTGWYRLAPTSAPETGSNWSPNAQIVGGVKCVKSIETSPGVKRLLVGPATSGPILYRDLTTNADNGTPYAANVRIGSLVFAQSNQCAEIESVTLVSKLTGTRPSVGILGDEISGSFETLTHRVDDPPFLGTPTSLFSDRWYFSTLLQPAWMMHMQMQISWIAENASSELFSYSIFGCTHSERE